jgi:hypothetical protein
MGTRNLTAVFIGGQYKVAQYGQWDGYPKGQGKTILNFLKYLSAEGLKVFKAKCQAAQWISEDEAKQQWVDCGADPKSDWVTMDVSDKHTARYPENSRDTGGKILRMILESRDGIKLENQIEFVGDAVFCEWAYVIDFDNNVLEVYSYPKEGKKIMGRFVDMPHESKKWNPINLIVSYKLNKLPSLKKFYKDCGVKEKE